MADKADASRRSPSPPERIKSSSAEDPDTAAARKEFDNAAISEKPDPAVMSSTAKDSPAAEPASASDKTSEKAKTPTSDNEIVDAQNDKMKEQISSPKKKRAHAEVDESRETPRDVDGDVSPIGANGNTSLGRTNRSEPEKKRHRDISSETKEAETSTKSTVTNVASSAESATADTKAGTKPAADKTTSTSTSAFKSSGLSGFAASSASPFLQSGAKPLTSFASSSGSASPFGASKPEGSSVFGGSSFANGSSPFGQLAGASAPKPFGGSVFGGGFGGGLGALGGNKLTSFAKPGETFKSSKPPKAFGAPESDAESNDEEGGEDESNDGDEEKPDKEENEHDGDRKKTKLQRVAVDNGEAGEVTILQVRAKIYHLDKTATPAVWKERGAGNLKINVPESTVDTDENGAPIPGSFDASGLEDAEVRTVRLVMRQDSTHRVILNTAIIPAMQFQEKSTNKAVCVLFTAIEGGGEAVSIQVKLNPTNAKSFLNEVGKIQRELQSS